MEIGQLVENFTVNDNKGNLFGLYDELKNRPLVLFFYPKDETKGCIAEVCAFRDFYQDFIDLGYEVVGVSSDNQKSHENFVAHYSLPFRLLVDEGGAIRKKFNVKKSFFIIEGRETFIIGQDSKIKFKFNSLTQSEKHVIEALTFIKKN